MAEDKDILAPVDTTNSTSPSIRHAAEEPANWRRLGDMAAEALERNPLKHPFDPAKDYE